MANERPVQTFEDVRRLVRTHKAQLELSGSSAAMVRLRMVEEGFPNIATADESLMPEKMMALELIGQSLARQMNDRRMKGNRSAVAAQSDDDLALEDFQFDFSDLDESFSLRCGDEEIYILKGDFQLPHIETHRKQIEKNISMAINGRERFERECYVIVPLLEANPKWRWRDAVARLSRDAAE